MKISSRRKMSLMQGESLEFVLQKFPLNLPISRITRCHVDFNRQWLGLELQGQQLSLVSIARGIVGERVVGHRVHSFQWRRPSNAVVEDGSTSARFACVGDGHLYEYEVQLVGDGAGTRPLANCIVQCPTTTLHTLLTGDTGTGDHDVEENLKLLGFRGNLLVVCVGQQVACLSWLRHKVPELVGSFLLEGSITKMKLFGNHLVAFTDDKKASVWDVDCCTKVNEINTFDLVGAEEIADFTLSTNLKHLMVITTRNVLTGINLDRYFEFSGGHLVKKPSSVSNACCVDKFCASPCFPDTGWREKLRSLEHWNHDHILRRGSKVSDDVSNSDGRMLQHTSPQNRGEKVSGFYRASGLPTTPGQGLQNIVHQVLLPDCVQDTLCHDMSMVGNCITMWFASKTKTTSWLVTRSIQQNCSLSSMQHYFLGECTVVLSDRETSPSFVLTAEELRVVAFNTEQEQLVNRLMMYASAAVADSLCCVNNWDRCSIPMHALEVGLKHRQLDTVAFFLKSRENVFSIQELNSSSESEGIALQKEDGSNDLDLSQVHAAVQLLITTIKDNITDHPSKQFAEQLLFITLDYLHKVVRNIVQVLHCHKGDGTSNEDLEEEIDAALFKLTDYIVELRQYLKGLPAGSEKGNKHFVSRSKVIPGSWHPVMESGAFRLTIQQRKIVQDWDSMSNQDVICDGILQGEVPLLQAYLHSRCRDDPSILKHLIEFGLERALHYLQEHQLLLSAQMLENMGFNVWQKLHQICLYTPDRGLRDFLIAHLTAEDHLTEEEKEMVKFVHQLEQLYCCSSFEMAKLMRTEGEPRNWESKLDLGQLLSPAECQEVLGSCGDIASGDLSNSENASYAHVLLEWVRTWDTQSRQKILLEQILYRNDHQHAEGISAAVVWSYLLTHMDMARLKEWIEAQYPQHSTSESQMHSTWPYNLALSSDLLDQLDQTTSYMANQLLDLFARRGVFSPRELHDFHLLLGRLARSHAVIQQPHILELRPATHNLTVINFHRHMIKYSIQKHLPELLYYYLDYWQLCTTCCDLGEVGMGQEDVPGWVEMMLNFRRAANLETDPLTVFEASLSAHSFVEKLQTSSVNEMLDKGLTGRALATLMYNPDMLQQLLSNRGGSQDKLREGLSQFPRLQQALFPPDPADSAQEVTVYKLLQGNAPFDPTRLFGWQKTNTLATDDVMREMPHFSHADMVSRFGHVEHLRFTYYLKQGRPTFAFCAYLIEQLQAGVKSLSVRRLRSVCSKAHHLAIKHFSETHIAAACVAFTEMLGQDSTSMRIHIQVASLVLAYNCADIQGSLDQRKLRETVCTKEIIHLLYNTARKGRKAPGEILGKLEAATRWQINKHRINCTSWEAAEHWMLAVLYCKLHNLPLSTEYLFDCAQHDQWAAFLTFAQVHLYPKDQLLEVLPAFSSQSLREHLHYVVENVTTSAKTVPKVQVKGRDVRAQLYARIGLSPSMSRDSGGGESSSEEEEMSEVVAGVETPPSSDQASLSLPDFTLPFDGNGKDIITVILECLANPCPWRCLAGFAIKFCNPVLAVLAASCHENDMVSCLCAWLAANCILDVRSTILTKFPQIETRMWTLDELEDLMLTLMTAGMMRTVRDGFKIFHPECTLLPLLEFGAAFVRYEEPDVCKAHLDAFKQLLHKLQRQSRSSVSDECDVIFGLEWVEKTAAALLHHFLASLPHAYEMGLFLRLLDQTNVTRLCSCPVADFSRLYQLHQISKNCGVHLNYLALGFAGRPEYENECSKVLAQLQAGRHYSEARVFAEVTKVPNEQITTQQLTSELEELKMSQAWDSTKARCAFWRHCHELLTKYRVSPLTASQFYRKHIDGCTNYEEKGLVCQLAYDWLTKVDRSCQNQDCEDMFIKMWKSRIQAYLQKQQTEDTTDLFESLDGETKDPSRKNSTPKSELLECHSVPNPSQPSKVTLEPEEKLALDALIGELLEAGHVASACEVARRLGHYSQDLAIVMSCVCLAQGTIRPDELDPSLKQLIASTSRRRSRRISNASLVSLPRIGSTVSLASIPVTGDESELESDAALAAMGLLNEHTTNGSQCCIQVITSYRIAKVLGESYQWVSQQGEFLVLQAVLSSKAPQRFALAKAFIASGCLSTDQVAGFLSDAILQALQAHLGGTGEHSEESGGWNLVLRPSTATDIGQSTNAMQLIQLCQDPARLGQRLHDSVVSLLSSDIEDSAKMLTIEVELLIYAHDCHTLACNMEGVSAVLRTARTLTAVLAKVEEYNLMIRLLTGVGRFSEMTYIFDTLKQQHQFELLFRKGIDKEEKLRLSILDYLQRYHPTDTDTFTMVMLHFTMFREIALMLEEAASKHLKMFQGKSLDNTPDVQAVLQNIVHYYSDAAESYVKENCLRHAQNCVKQARLVALQMQLLASNQQVINLDKAKINSFIANHGKFYEAFIVSDAYNHHSSWPFALLNQVVLHGDFKYLADFQRHINLKPELLGEVAERYRTELQKPKQAMGNMKKLVSYCPEVKTAYRLAIELGFTDLARDLLKGGGGAYLKDTIGLER